MHLGNAYSALVAYERAQRAGGRFLLRIEDIDRQRCRPEFEAALLEDLAWLGLHWEQPVLRQSDNMAAYGAALQRLSGMGLLYPCFCTRREIAREIANSPAAPHGPDGPVYPGTCRMLTAREREERMAAGTPYALRLDSARAQSRLPADCDFRDERFGRIAVDALLHGDVVLARKDVPASYHLAVTVDDAAQGVTLVVRGEDLLPATHVHRTLQELLGLPAPGYLHHRLVRDDAGTRMAKRQGTPTLRALREEGAGAAEIRASLGFTDLF
jgi:glutamyl-Q tRNA(Asp) synthetase